ncbi:MAG TPA: histidinol dehydrogenase, partial [Solirubrobacteraceae bacterium]|nr:histidinol dehydrogenase [Solirubrobacteraceae bacterium]
MRVARLSGPDAAAALRALAPGGASVRAEVERIVEQVRSGGDEALRELVARLDGLGPDPPPLRVEPHELDAAVAGLRGDVRAGLETAMANVAAVASASLGDDAEVVLPQGQRILVRELPVRRAAIYVPGGRAPYPSTVVMGVVTAQVAGVESIAVCAPGSHEVILAACALCGVDEVWRMGGAHGVAALAYGTATVERADVIAGPGGLWVQEAKRLVSGDVGIDGFLGPSDVVVIASAGADPGLVALDLLAQAEHGEGTIVAAVSDDAALLDVVAARLQEAPETGAAAGLVAVADAAEALAVAEAFAPEHLELVGAAAEALAPRVRAAGCVFVGAAGATAFGDYVAGSNHSLPTGGAARFASALSPRAFRRRMAEVHV